MDAGTLAFVAQSPIFDSACPASAKGSAVTDRTCATPKRYVLREPPRLTAGGFVYPLLREWGGMRILCTRLTGRGVTTTAAPGGSRPLVIPKSLPNLRFPLLARGEMDAHGLATVPFQRGSGVQTSGLTKRFSSSPGNAKKKESTIMAKCQATTRKGKPCPNEDATLDPASGEFQCHVHHPQSIYRQQVAANREYRQRHPKPKRVRRPRRPWPPLDTAVRP